MSRLKDLRERQEQIVSEARERLDQISAATDEARAAELESQHDTAMAEYDRLEKQITREETGPASTACCATAAGVRDSADARWRAQLALRPNGMRVCRRLFQFVSRAMTSSAGRSGASRSRIVKRNDAGLRFRSSLFPPWPS